MFRHYVIEFFKTLLRDWKYTSVNFHKFPYMIEHGMYIRGYIFCLVNRDELGHPLSRMSFKFFSNSICDALCTFGKYAIQLEKFCPKKLNLYRFFFSGIFGRSSWILMFLNKVNFSGPVKVLHFNCFKFGPTQKL